MHGAVAALPPDAAAAASDSVGAAHQVAAESGAADLVASANQAFVDAMGTTAGIAAARERRPSGGAPGRGPCARSPR